MKVSRKSWHYKLVTLVNDPNPKNLCEYLFWSFVGLLYLLMLLSISYLIIYVGILALTQLGSMVAIKTPKVFSEEIILNSKQIIELLNKPRNLEALLLPSLIISIVRSGGFYLFLTGICTILLGLGGSMAGTYLLILTGKLGIKSLKGIKNKYPEICPEIKIED